MKVMGLYDVRLFEMLLGFRIAIIYSASKIWKFYILQRLL